MTTVKAQNEKVESQVVKGSKKTSRKKTITKEEKANDLLFDVPKDIELKSEWAQAIRWHSLTKLMRKSLGLTNNVEKYAEVLGIGRMTILRWRQRDDFWEAVQRQQKLLFKADYMGEMFQAMYKKSLKDGDPNKVKLMAQYTGVMKEEAFVFTLPPDIQTVLEKVSKVLPK